MDFRSPSDFCALAITVFASCAMAFPHRYARLITTTVSFFTTAIPPLWQEKRCFRNADYTLTQRVLRTSSDTQSNGNTIPDRHDGRIVTVICVEQLVEGANTLR